MNDGSVSHRGISIVVVRNKTRMPGHEIKSVLVCSCEATDLSVLFSRSCENTVNTCAFFFMCGAGDRGEGCCCGVHLVVRQR